MSNKGYIDLILDESKKTYDYKVGYEQGKKDTLKMIWREFNLLEIDDFRNILCDRLDRAEQLKEQTE